RCLRAGAVLGLAGRGAFLPHENGHPSSRPPHRRSRAMTPDFSGRTVLVTGASRGIGLGIARAFAAAGADLHMLADDPTVESAAAELGARGYVADITDEAALNGVFARIPKLDILVNNAGLERLTPIEDDSAE